MRARSFLPFLALFVALLTQAIANPTNYGIGTVVLDAGHGGSDPGAVYGGVREKDLTLMVVLRLGRKIESGMPGVKVVYTRTSDRALAATKVDDLQKRADIANRAEGDLFISVHVNAAKSPQAHGVETLIMGETPKEQSRNEDALYSTNRDDLLDMSNEREAAIVRAYIQNLQFTYGQYSEAMARCLQNRYVKSGRYSRGVKRQPLRVLYASNMPGILTEIGFLSHKQDFAYLKSDKGLDRIVEDIYQAVRDYSDYVLEARRAEEQPRDEAQARPVEPETVTEAVTPPSKQMEPTLYDPRLYQSKEKNSEQTAAKPQAEQSAAAIQGEKPAAKPATKPATEQQGATKQYYTVQVMASKKQLSLNSSDFKRYKGRVHQYESEGTYRYKYGVGRYATRGEAIEAAAVVQKTFPQAFVVAVEDGRTVVTQTKKR